MAAFNLRRLSAVFTFILAALVVVNGQAAESPLPANRLSALEHDVALLQRRLGSAHLAQMVDRPGEDVPNQAPDGPPAQQGDDPSLRLDRLESTLRNLTGRVETAEHEARRLEDEMKKFRQDMEFKLQDLAAARPKGRHSEADEQPAVPAVPAPARTAKRHGDAFDPDADPNAPGAPRSLGSVPAANVAPAERKSPRAQGPEEDANGPLDLTRGAAGSITPRRGAVAAEADLPSPAGTSSTGSAAGGARAEFDQAVSLLRAKQYQSAESTFQTFIQKHPRDRLVADAVYYLGETYALRGRQREAAEQFLKVSTDYAKSPRAPVGMVKLGVSLNALGAKEQACATFGDVTRKFPNATTAVKNSADRESKRARC